MTPGLSLKARAMLDRLAMAERRRANGIVGSVRAFVGEELEANRAEVWSGKASGLTYLTVAVDVITPRQTLYAIVDPRENYEIIELAPRERLKDALNPVSRGGLPVITKKVEDILMRLARETGIPTGELAIELKGAVELDLAKSVTEGATEVWQHKETDDILDFVTIEGLAPKHTLFAGVTRCYLREIAELMTGGQRLDAYEPVAAPVEPAPRPQRRVDILQLAETQLCNIASTRKAGSQQLFVEAIAAVLTKPAMPWREKGFAGREMHFFAIEELHPLRTLYARARQVDGKWVVFELIDYAELVSKYTPVEGGDDVRPH